MTHPNQENIYLNMKKSVPNNLGKRFRPPSQLTGHFLWRGFPYLGPIIENQPISPRSALWHCTIGLPLRLIGKQQLAQSLLVLQLITQSMWSFGNNEVEDKRSCVQNYKNKPCLAPSTCLSPSGHCYKKSEIFPGLFIDDEFKDNIKLSFCNWIQGKRRTNKFIWYELFYIL